MLVTIPSNASTEDVVVHGDDVAQGHRGPFSNDEDVAPSSAAAVRRDQDALYDVQVSLLNYRDPPLV